MIELRKLEIKEYAEAVIYAFEFKEPITSFCFRGKNELGYFLECMNDFKKSINLINLIEEERNKRKNIKKISDSIILA
ncbi:hypothetical protein BKK50_09035 [Rodentibacter rarus]|uniref:Uncharacterized protein n=1 Tax=Rodentibacter rarus TaxID=1908260 RepID=A0A1V3IID6_9PAST|nr:hypothetical protein [Rodentibacter rarus]OOF41026.1 hypothetical protein BKK50_09035 [Rodentibacter rarus]